MRRYAGKRPVGRLRLEVQLRTDLNSDRRLALVIGQSQGTSGFVGPPDYGQRLRLTVRTTDAQHDPWFPVEPEGCPFRLGFARAKREAGRGDDDVRPLGRHQEPRAASGVRAC